MAIEQNSGDLAMFEDLLSDEGAIHQHDPLDESGYANYENFDKFQDESKSTRTVSDNGYKTIDTSILDDVVKDEDDYQNDDIVNSILKAKGFNPDSIKFEGENGEIEEYKFSELSKEDQLSLLASSEEYDESDLNQSELEAISFLRENNMTISDLAQAIRQKTIEELQNSEPVYEVDDFTDEELFIADFRNKYGDDFTDEELLHELEKAQENEELFNKKVNKLRADYKSYEEEERKENELLKQKEQEQAYEAYVSTIVEAAKNINDLHDVAELEDSDKNDILNFILTEKQSGKTELQESLENPDTLFKVAWYVKHGDQVFKEMQKYYQGEIAKLSKNSTKKSVETVVKPNKTQHTTQQRPKRIEDLY